MKKKIIAIFLCLGIILNLAGCFPLTYREMYSGRTSNSYDMYRNFLEVVTNIPETITCDFMESDDYMRYYMKTTFNINETESFILC